MATIYDEEAERQGRILIFFTFIGGKQWLSFAANDPSVFMWAQWEGLHGSIAKREFCKLIGAEKFLMHRKWDVIYPVDQDEIYRRVKIYARKIEEFLQWQNGGGLQKVA